MEHTETGYGAVFLANVGQRDVLHKGKSLPSRSVRQESKELLQDKDAWNDITVPMILPALRDALTDVDKLDRVVLFSTDQEDENFKQGDTVHCGEIIKSLLPRYFGTHGRERVKAVSDIRNVRIRQQPNLYDAMMKEYAQHLDRLRRKNAVFSDGPVYVLCSGGTPQSNMALLFRAIEMFKERCKVIYVSEDGTPYRLDLPGQVLGSYRKETAKHLLDRWDFKGLAALAGLSEEIQLLANYAECRIRFDFVGALQAADKLTEMVNSPRRNFYARLRREIEVLQNPCTGERSHRDLARLNELASVTEVAYRQGEYTYFVGCLRRFSEATYHYVILNYVGIDCDAVENDDEFVEKLKEQGLYETVQRIVARHGRTKIARNIPTFGVVLAALANRVERPNGRPLSEQDRQLISRCNSALAEMQSLNDARNRSILGHGYRGVSVEDIRAVAKHPERLAGNIVEELRGTGWQNVYAEIKGGIEEMLERDTRS